MTATTRRARQRRAGSVSDGRRAGSVRDQKRACSRRSRFRLVAGVAIGTLLLSIGCTKTSSPGAGGSGNPPGTFTVVNPQRKALPRMIEQPGSIRADEEAPLYAKLTAYVKAVRADIGAAVEPGAVLAELSIPE